MIQEWRKEMSMITVIPAPDGKNKFITQQYEMGLYIAVYQEGSTMPIQTSSSMKEKAFHKKLRKQCPDFILEESSVI